MTGVAIRSLAARWPGLAGSFVALTLGVALVAAAGLALAAALTAPERPARWYASADVVITGPASVPGRGNTALPAGERGHVPAGVPARVAAVPGVRQVVLDRAGYAHGEGVTEAHPWQAASLHPHRLLAGGPPEADDQAVVTAPTQRRPGDQITITTVDGVEEFTVSGVLDSDAPPALYVTDATARRLARDRIAAVAAVAAPGADPAPLAAAVRAALANQPGLRVLTGGARGAAEPDPEAGLLLAAGTLLGQTAGIAAVVSAIVVAGTFGFTTTQRRREFALLRAAGATPRQVRRLVLAEAAAVGGLGAVAGCGLGVAIADPFAHWLARGGLAPAQFATRFEVWPLLAAAGIGLVVSLAGAWAAARRAGRVEPVQAMREVTVEPARVGSARWLAGLAALGGAGLVVPLLTGPAGSAYLLVVALLLLTGGAVLAPAVIPALARILGAGARRGIGSLAGASARAAVRRTAATATPVLITVGLAGAALSGTATYSATQAADLRAAVTAPLVLIAADPAGMSGTAADEAARLPGVTAAVPVKETVAFDSDGATVAQRAAWYADGPAIAGALRLPVITGTVADLTGTGTVAVSRALADAHGWTVGAEAQLWLGDGAPVRLRVVAVLAQRLGLPAVLLPWSLAESHTGAPVPDAVYLAVAPGTDRGGLAAAAPPGTAVTATGAHLSTLDAEFDRLARLALFAIVGLAVAYTCITIANTHLMATAARAGELATLRLAGASPRQVVVLVGVEALLATGAGVLLAAVVTAATLGTLAAALAGVTARIQLAVPWPQVGAVTGACVLIAMLASLGPVLLRLRRDPL